MLKKPGAVGLTDPSVLRKTEGQLAQASIIASGKQTISNGELIKPFTTVSTTSNSVTSTTNSTTNTSGDTTTIYTAPGSVYVSAIDQTIRNVTTTIGVSSIIAGENISISSTKQDGTGDVTISATGGIGLSGFSGFSGATGPQGISGFSGATGPQGISGFSGAQGISGFSGAGGSLGNLTVSNVTISTVTPTDPVKFQTSYNTYTNWISEYQHTANAWWTSTAIDSTDNVYMIGGTNTIPFVVKYDSLGNALWQYNYVVGELTPPTLIGECIDLDSSNNPVITIRDTTNLLTYVAKINGSTGELLWAKTIDKSSYSYRATSLCIDASDNVLVALSYDSTKRVILVVKLDSSGNQVWVKDKNVDGDNYSAWATSVTVQPSGNVIVVGNVTTSAPITSFLIRYDSSGTELSARQFTDAYINNVRTDSTGNIYILGRSWSVGEYNQCFIAQLEPVSPYAQQWAYYLDFPGVDLYGLSIDGSNNVYVTGSEQTVGMLLFKFNSTGTLQWQRTITNSATDFVLNSNLNTSSDVNSVNLVIAASNYTLGVSSQALAFKLLNTGAGTGTYSTYTYAASTYTFNNFTVSSFNPEFSTPVFPVTISNSILAYSTINYNTDVISVGAPTLAQSNFQINGDGSLDTPSVTIGNSSVSAAIVNTSIDVSTTNTTKPFWFSRYGGNIQVDPYTDFWMYAEGVASDSNGNVFLYGGNDGDFGVPILLKYNTNGNLVWQKSITYDLNNAWLTGEVILCDSIDNIVVVIQGQDQPIDPDPPQSNFLVKLDNNGTILWQRAITYPAPIVNGNLINICVAIDGNDNIYVVNSPQNNSQLDSYVIKYDSTGTIQWQRKIEPNPISEAPPQSYRLRTMHVTSNGRIYVGVESMTNQYTSSIWVLDSSGTFVTDYQIQNFTIRSITSDPLNNYYVAGDYLGPNMPYGAMHGQVLKYNGETNATMWAKLFYRTDTTNYSIRAYTLKYKNNALYLLGSPNIGASIVSMNAGDGTINWQNQISIKPEYISDYGVYSWYYSGLDSLITVTDDSVIFALNAEGPDIADMMALKVPNDGSGTGFYDIYEYSQSSLLIQEDAPTVTEPNLFASTTGDIVDSTGTNTADVLTYIAYLTQLYPAGIRNWNFDNYSRLTFPDGTVQSTAFNPTANNTFINSLSTYNINFSGSDLALGQYALASQNGISIGRSAGGSQEEGVVETIAIGSQAQASLAKSYAIGIGLGAGLFIQGTQAIALGYYAGAFNQGANSIAIGYQAGYNALPANSIVLNATGTLLNASFGDSFTVKPIRQANTANALFYNPTTGEITYDAGGGGGGGTATIPQATYSSANYTLVLTDSGKHFYSTTSSDQTVNIPLAASVAFEIGTVLTFIQRSPFSTYVNAVSGVTLYMSGNASAANRVIGPYGQGTLLKVDTNVWVINGIGVS